MVFKNIMQFLKTFKKKKHLGVHLELILFKMIFTIVFYLKNDYLKNIMFLR